MIDVTATVVLLRYDQYVCAKECEHNERNDSLSVGDNCDKTFTLNILRHENFIHYYTVQSTTEYWLWLPFVIVPADLRRDIYNMNIPRFTIRTATPNRR